MKHNKKPSKNAKSVDIKGFKRLLVVIIYGVPHRDGGGITRPPARLPRNRVTPSLSARKI